MFSRPSKTVPKEPDPKPRQNTAAFVTVSTSNGIPDIDVLGMSSTLISKNSGLSSSFEIFELLNRDAMTNETISFEAKTDM